jgi:YesN/AraC family two-component response regulator
MDTADELKVRLDQSLILPILSFNSADQFRETFTMIIQQLCMSFQKNKEIGNEKIWTEVLSFIENNYTSPVFSLDLAADSLKISKQSISAIVKEAFNCGFAQYTASLRMREVKRLLVKSDMNIKDIISGVGYMDIPNFLRKFKQLEGLTPSQYRELKKI